MQRSQVILEHFRKSYAKDIDLTLRPAYRTLLERLGSPHRHLPPVFHVAGTNGKGSTCAFLRAILEAEGYRVHVYTSPHLVTFHERIRVAGQLIDEEKLASILSECQRLAEPRAVSYFEVATAAAFVAFVQKPADFTILEVGLGGRRDATNVIDHPIATVINRISFDHCEYLGKTLGQIATEKAGIMKPGVRCFAAPTHAPEVLQALTAAAYKNEAPLFIGNRDWFIQNRENGFNFQDAERNYDLPHPALIGGHQIDNAGLAIAALSALDKSITRDALVRGLKNVEWVARLQKLNKGELIPHFSKNWEFWLDGGHNDSAGEVLALQAKSWCTADNQKLFLVLGMLTTKAPAEFLSPLKAYATAITTVTIEDEPLSFDGAQLASLAQNMGFQNVTFAPSLKDALKDLVDKYPTGRVLICGSLYLAGNVLRLNKN